MPAMSVVQQLVGAASPARRRRSPTGNDVTSPPPPAPLSLPPQLARHFADYFSGVGGRPSGGRDVDEAAMMTSSSSTKGPMSSGWAFSSSSDEETDEHYRRWLPPSRFLALNQPSKSSSSGREVHRKTPSGSGFSVDSVTSQAAALAIKREPTEVDNASDSGSGNLDQFVGRYSGGFSTDSGTERASPASRHSPLDSRTTRTPARTPAGPYPVSPNMGYHDDTTTDSKVTETAQRSRPETTSGQTKRYACHICEYIGTSEPEYLDHVAGHHEYKCDQCQYMASHPGRLKRHVEEVHKPKDAQSSAQSKPASKRCRHCQERYTDMVAYYDHIRTHMRPDRILTCPVPDCPFVTSYSHAMELHTRNHNNLRPYKCPRCTYRCAVRSMLTSHLKSHSKVHPYRCGVCNFSSKFSNALKRHLLQKGHEVGYVLNEDGSIPEGGGVPFYATTPSARGRKRVPNEKRPRAPRYAIDEGDRGEVGDAAAVGPASTPPLPAVRSTSMGTPGRLSVASPVIPRPEDVKGLLSNMSATLPSVTSSSSWDAVARRELSENVLSRTPVGWRASQLPVPGAVDRCYMCGHQAADYVQLLTHIAVAHSLLAPFPVFGGMSGTAAMLASAATSSSSSSKRRRTEMFPEVGRRNYPGDHPNVGFFDGQRPPVSVPLPVDVDVMRGRGRPTSLSEQNHIRGSDIFQSAFPSSRFDMDGQKPQPFQSPPAMLPTASSPLDLSSKSPADLGFSPPRPSTRFDASLAALFSGGHVASPVPGTAATAPPVEQKRSRRKGRAFKLDVKHLNTRDADDDEDEDGSQMEERSSSTECEPKSSFGESTHGGAIVAVASGQPTRVPVSSSDVSRSESFDGSSLPPLVGANSSPKPPLQDPLPHPVYSSSSSTEQIHFRSASPAALPTPARGGSVARKSEYFECEHCGIGYGERKLFAMHMDFHDRSDPFTCNMCGTATRNAVEFYSHIALAPHVVRSLFAKYLI